MFKCLENPVENNAFDDIKPPKSTPNKSNEKIDHEQSNQLLSLNLFSNRMLSLFSLQLNTDLTVICLPKTFLTHKAILSASSVVFRLIFRLLLTLLYDIFNNQC